MTEAMPFLQKTILLSYDPRSFRPGDFSTLDKSGETPIIKTERPYR